MNASVAFLILLAALSAVLLTSGVGKLRSDSSEEDLEALGVPAWLRHRALIAAHPWVEILLGVLLLLTTGRLLVAVTLTTLALTILYAVLITRVVRTGSAKTCHCFGDMFDAQLTWRSVIRNLILVGLALAALAGALAGESAPSVVGADAAVLLPVLAAAIVGVLVWATVSIAAPEISETPEVGSALSGEVEEYHRFPIPLAWLKDAYDNPMTLREIAHDQARLLIFLSTGCSSCESLVEDIPTWVEEFPALGVHAVFFDSKEDVTKGMPTVAPYAVYDEGAEASRALDMGGFPSAVILGMDGLLAGGPVRGPNAVRDLVDQLREEFVEDEVDEEAQTLPTLVHPPH